MLGVRIMLPFALQPLFQRGFNVITYYVIYGFGGLVVRMLASGFRVHGFKPGRSHWIFSVYKILSMPSSGGEVK
jgi:uncharacterized membrane protein